ncbi:helix-turn-helix transcriptional regulator [Nocardioides sp.]|uniref:helix-turn-helix domain-containing protein n=1 Tax=Nocardioides sp. TaxID=35761 RepID=UPI0026202090|nr:helix-turn-helix transcriptional regulator [Nocardioides sp.]
MTQENVVPLRRPTVPSTSAAAPEPLWREALGRELRQVRQDQARTLAEVAQRAGVSVQYLSEVERGLKEPSSEIVGAVTGALGLRLVDLTARVTRSLGRIGGPVCLAA